MRPFASKRAEARLSLQEELVVAIHGAFEVAVEIAVQEVTKLVGQLTGDGYEEMRRENECLKRRLQRAEALLDAVEGEGDACLQQRSPGPTAGSVHGHTGVKGDASAPVERPPDPQHKPRAPEQRQGSDVEKKHGGDSASDPQGGYGGLCLVLFVRFVLFVKMSLKAPYHALYRCFVTITCLYPVSVLP